MVKDKSKPKKAMSPYAVFVQAMREEHKKKNPSVNVDFATFSKDCATKWKTLNPKDKKKYDDIAAKDKDRYSKAMKSYTPPADEGGKKKKKKKDPNAPKRPMSAFFLFCQDERPKVREIHPDWPVGTTAKELATRWEQCKNKPKYEAQAVVEKKKYTTAMEKYKKTAIEQDSS